MSESDFFSNNLTEEERELYDRQFRLQGWNQSILKNSRVLMVGVGGLGCEIAKNLTMVGVGHIDLVDLDVIEHSNLNRQMLFIGAKVARPKALAAVDMLKKINPNITIKGYRSSLEQLPPVLYKKADVIISGLDSMQARLNLNTQVIRFNKPLVDGGVNGYHGHIYTIFPKINACFECYSVSSSESDDMAACTVVGIPRKRIHCLFKAMMKFEEINSNPPNVKNIKELKFLKDNANELVEKFGFEPLFEEKEIIQIIDHHDPGIITINAVIASIQSHEVIKILNYIKGNKGLGIPNKSYIIYNGMTARFYHLDKPRNDKCPQCGDDVLWEDFYLRKDQPLQLIIDGLKMKGHNLDSEMEPIITIPDFNSIRELDLQRTVLENRLFPLSLLTISGFTEGDIYVTLHIFKDKTLKHSS
ncbi:MAG: ThiF family adenylyltransferase [Candidatus Lokiarchaeota archaeon]|nr:ThiF family adenylyltransferase [Candidatus Lokiarchaeota archaeon]